MLNRLGRRMYAKNLGIETPKGEQDSATPRFKIVLQDYKVKSKAGIEYTKTRKIVESFNKTFKERIFAK